MTEKSNELNKIKSLEILLNKYKSENEYLNSQNENLRKYKIRFLGYTLMLLSTIILLISVFLIKDLQFVFLGFIIGACILLAIYLVFIYFPKNYNIKVLNSALKLAIDNLYRLGSHYHLERNAIFLPTADNVYQFIPFSGTNKNIFPLVKDLNNDVFEIENKGIILHPIGFSIFELVKKEFSLEGDKIKSEKLELLIQEILIDQLNLVKIVNLRKPDKGQYELILSENVFDTIYQSSKKVPGVYTQIGCPISTFVAILLALSTSRAILLKSVDFSQTGDNSIIVYELGDIFH